MKRLWRRYISSQFLRYDRFWREPPCKENRSPGDVSVFANPSNAGTGSSISRAIKQLPRHRRRLLSHVRQLASSERMWEACQTKQTLTIASDGGLKGRKGTFGWLVTTPSDEILVEGAGPVDGPFNTANSTRCELGGYAASLLYLALLHSVWGKRHKCRFRWLTDSKGAIAKVQKHSNHNVHIKQRQPSNADYLGIIQLETSAIRRRIKTEWVKGHQSMKEGQGNRRDIKWNHHADKLASWYRDQTNQRQSVEHTEHTPEARVSIIINGVRVVGQEEASSRYHINGYHLRQYIQSRQKWTNQVWDRTDLEVFGTFHNRLSPSAQIAHTKFAFEQWCTGTKRFRIAPIKDDNLDKCPCCKEHENWQHVLRCRQNPDRTKTLTELAKRLTPTEFQPVFTLLRDGVLTWLEGNTYDPDISGFPMKLWGIIRNALSDQEQIGWQNAMKGYLSVEWRAIAETDPYGTAIMTQEGKGIHTLRTILIHVNQATQCLWKAQNNLLHQSNEAEMQLVRDSEIAEIREMHASIEKIPAANRHYCERSLDVLLKKNHSSRRRWLRYMRMARARMEQDGKRQLLLTQFFRPVSI
ncbi:hypothetical protein MHU86_16945 [Fragilaria crotonensis]|nr:hypothetical protein MHU86_16945 [Fragilaria crotonensis]